MRVKIFYYLLRARDGSQHVRTHIDRRVLDRQRFQDVRRQRGVGVGEIAEMTDEMSLDEYRRLCSQRHLTGRGGDA